jgi:hypothetical protein
VVGLDFARDVAIQRVAPSKELLVSQSVLRDWTHLLEVLRLTLCEVLREFVHSL